VWGPRSTRKEGGQLHLLPLVHVKHQQQEHHHFKILKPKMLTKSHKLKYHFDWIFTLIMNLSLDFTVNVCIERKVRKQIFDPTK